MERSDPIHDSRETSDLMTGSEIRIKFLEFFKKRGHAVVPSSSLVPNDSTLLLTAAGMVQFKPVFLGAVKAPYARAASCQKCVRTTDIDRVGHTARHLTFFEMLGNFSFGDYYKEEAIPWAWEFLTKEVGLDAGHLWITIFREDDEAFEIWRDKVGIPEEKIVRLGEEDNFWSAGPTGPCGPCSEIIYDFGLAKGCGQPDCRVGCDCDRFLEVWNLVFMQYDRDEQGNLNHLARKGIDTGMGLERLASILEGVETNFENDLFQPIIKELSRIASVKHGSDERLDTSLKIIADHTRAVTFLIADGVLPSNEGRGYILRRLLRRAVRHGRLIGIERLFLVDLIKKVVGLMGPVYPELKDHESFVLRIAQSEEERFSKTLKQGLNLLSEAISKLKAAKKKEMSGEIAFQLYDTYGFPLELTTEVAGENDLGVDLAEFEKLMEEQKERAKASWEETSWTAPKEVYQQILDQFGKTTPTCDRTDDQKYRLENVPIKAVLHRGDVKETAGAGEEIELILQHTPFYAEMGGQVGDQGIIETVTGKVEVYDTLVPLPELRVHHGKVVEGMIKAGQEAKAAVFEDRRKAIARNHTATHLLHWALRTVLGEHVKQAGSLVEDKRLRFDFTHFEALSPQQLREIEQLVNEKIFENSSVEWQERSYDEAKKEGAIALFGEKYADKVRVVKVGGDEKGYSKELCGGTHVDRTAEVGLFKIVSESSIGANLRRVEAVTSKAALNYIYQEEDTLEGISRMLKTSPGSVLSRIETLVAELREKEQQEEKLKHHLIKREVEEILSKTTKINGFEIVIATVSANKIDELRTFADVLKERLMKGIIVLAASSEGKVMLLSAATPDAVKAGFHAGRLLKEIAPLVNGDGGGRPEMAQAGGKKPEGIEEALNKAKALAASFLKTDGK